LHKNKGLVSKSGLALIAIITLISATAVITISGSVKKSSATLDDDELHRRHNAQALLTAESGLMIATNIFKANGLSAAPITINLDGSEVTIESTSAGAKDGYVRILSTVRHLGLDYDKRVEWQVLADSELAPAAPAVPAKISWREADIPRS
jgi:hypothetical protein